MNKKIVCVPFGRRRYTEVQFKHILKQRNNIDEYRLWLNTKNEDDLHYAYHLQSSYSDFVTLDASRLGSATVGTNLNIGGFFAGCCDVDSIYIRVDDDIVWFEDDFFNGIFKFRELNPQPFLIYANIINNAFIDSLRQGEGKFLDVPLIGLNCSDKVGWENAPVAEKKHRVFLKSLAIKESLDNYKICNFKLNCFSRVSINAIAWLGETFNKFNGVVESSDEEVWLSTIKPKQLNQPNLICGKYLCSHFAFFTQRKLLDNTNILSEYSKYA